MTLHCLLAGAVDQLDAVSVRILDEADARSALADAVGLSLRLDPLLGERSEGRVEIVDGVGDVAVGAAELVAAAVVVDGDLELCVVAGQGEEVVGRLVVTIANDRQLAAEREAERLEEWAAPLGVVRVRADAGEALQRARS